AADAVDWVRLMEGKGIRGGAAIDWPGLMRFKRTFTEPVPEHRERAFLKAGMDVLHGTARFTGPNSLQIGNDELQARFILIGTGMRPATLGIPGEDLVTLSDDFLDLEQLPPRVVFTGGGYISMEFAHVSARAGADVTVLHRGDRPLEGFDPDLVKILVEKTRSVGIRLELETGVTRIERIASGLRVHGVRAGADTTYDADIVVHGAGRVPNIDALELRRGNVEFGRGGVTVNEFLQSVSNPSVYAAGDAAASGGLPLTPVAGYEGQIVADNILKGNHRKFDHPVTPTVSFTIPPIASVGLQEKAAKEKGLRFRTHFEDTGKWYASRRVGETHSATKVLIEEGTDRILGAHLLDLHADELINVFALAIRFGITASDLKDFVFGYPTHASNIRYMV
ncbi:MAG: NAD(P)/FAD-dependent oxidoreductase, partial [Acidobacteria bacterium]|nr:NAD(P)/FAD-dependent oxidoreductase [Acidobacteriota bacterium]